MGCAWAKEARMADEVITKTTGLCTGTAVRPRGGRALQPEGEILLQICCRSSDGRSPTQLFIAAGDTEPSHRIPVYQP
jgi:hypothetical protein